ncbi:MAG: aldehyde ferredoxin oxidoreductase N-terminal domain-containing protein [Candidatus Bathyarchaeia archaeon]
MYGWVGRILKVDLADSKITEIPTTNYVPKLIGGRGVGAMIYWEMVPPECRAFDPENALIIMTGPATGTLAPGSSRVYIGFKSPTPLNECYCCSIPGGHWGAELKFAGYDGVVITGKAPEPVYLWINDGTVEIRDAKHLWGMTLTNLMSQIYKEHGPKTRILGIGPAGERLCREAAIIIDHEHATGIGGAGAVMGSKNLKAIAVLGTGIVKVAKPRDLMDLWIYYARLLTRKPGEKEYPSMHRSLCDGIYHPPHIPHCPGFPPIPDSDEKWWGNMGLDDPICLMAEAVKEGRIKLKWSGCYACPVNCALTWQSKDKNIPSGSGQCNDWMSWATWEWAGYRKVCGIPAILFDAYIDDMGLSKTNTLGYHFYWFLEDLVQLGIITKENTGLPIDKPWTAEFIKGVLEKFVRREGIFDKMAEGQIRFLKSLSEENPAVKQLYEQLFSHLPDYYVHWGDFRKGKFPLTPFAALKSAAEIRYWMVKVSFSRCIHDRLGVNPSPEQLKKINLMLFGSEYAQDIPGEPPTWRDKVPAVIIMQNWEIMSDCIPMCGWAGMPPIFSRYTLDKIGDPFAGSRIFSAVTGINITHEEMLSAMNIIFNIERCIHVREGRRREHDWYTDATFETPTWAWTSKEEFRRVMDEYYTLRGWDPNTGIPRRSTLEKLGLKKIADELETKYGVIVPP